jgi:hypothetical protein
MARSPRRHLTREQVIRAGKDMDNNIEKLPDGRCQYLNGFSDELIAEKHGAPLDLVQALRREVYGNLRQVPPQEASLMGDVLTLQAEIRELKIRMQQLETQNGELMTDLNKRRQQNALQDAYRQIGGPTPIPSLFSPAGKKETA